MTEITTQPHTDIVKIIQQSIGELMQTAKTDPEFDTIAQTLPLIFQDLGIPFSQILKPDEVLVIKHKTNPYKEAKFYNQQAHPDGPKELTPISLNDFLQRLSTTTFYNDFNQSYQR